LCCSCLPLGTALGTADSTGAFPVGPIEGAYTLLVPAAEICTGAGRGCAVLGGAAMAGKASCTPMTVASVPNGSLSASRAVPETEIEQMSESGICTDEKE